MSAFLSAYALLALANSRAPVTLNVSLADGATLAGESTIKVTVVANNPVTQVEFYVGTDLRDNATATPYLFKFDSLGENDGDLKFRFKAYTTEGETGEKVITVHVDNGVSKGAAFHVQKGNDYLTNSDWQPAITEGRIALKADPMSNPARVVLTRAYLGLHTFDKAQKYAEDAVAQAPNDAQALNLLSAVNIQIALGAVAKEGSDRKDLLTTVRDSLKSAITARRKVLDATVDNVPAPTDDASLVHFADVAIAAGRYGLAYEKLMPRANQGLPNPAVLNRLAYSLIRLSRFREAIDVFNQAQRLHSNDPVTNAILAVAYAELNDAESSDAALAAGKQADATNATLRTAEAYIALKYARAAGVGKITLALNYDDVGHDESAQKVAARQALGKALSGLLDDLGSKTETNYFAAALENKLEEYAKADRFFQDALLIEPANSDAYVEQGNRSIALSYRGKLDKDALQQQYDSAETMFLAALSASPSSPAALSGLAIVNTIEGKSEAAVKWAEAAVASDKNYSAGWVVLGTAYTAASKACRIQADQLRHKSLDLGSSPDTRSANEMKARELESKSTKYVYAAQDAAKSAAKLDSRIEGYDLTSAAAGWRYYYAGGRMPVLAAPSN